MGLRLRTNMGSMINADPHELAKFSELAHRWWDKESDFRPLHEINPLRLDCIDGLAGLDGKRVVDVGCGGGILADSMARRGGDVLGIDLAGKALRVAQLHAIEAGTPRVAYREVAVEALALEQPEAFDVVTCMEMLEHVPDPGSIVAACGQLLRPGGWAFFSTISRNARRSRSPSRRRARPEAAAEGNARVREVHSPERARRLVPHCRTRRRGDPGHGIQPVEPALPAVGRYERQLPRRLPQARMSSPGRVRRECQVQSRKGTP